MKAYRAKTKNAIACHGVTGGVVETPPDKEEHLSQLEQDKRAAHLHPYARQTALRPYSIHEISDRSLRRIFMSCLLFILVLLLLN